MTTRRELLYGAMIAGTSGLLSGSKSRDATRVDNVAGPEDESQGEARDAAQSAARSGLITGKAITMPYTEIAGFLSKEQLRWHHDSHYAGALAKFVELDKAVTKDHKTRAAKANSVLLHELYFANMTPRKTSPGRATSKALEQRFGAVDCWFDDFRAAAMSARGWGMLVWHPINRRLYNVAADAHNDGPLCPGVPLLVIDMYEHSYYIDFQNRKAAYVDGFLEHIDWGTIDKRMRRLRG